MPVKQTNSHIKNFYMPLFILILVCVLPLLYLYFNHRNSVDLETKMEAGLLFNLSNDEILFEKDIETKRSPASLTKLMSAYVILDIMEDPNLNWTDPVTIPKSATEVDGSKLWLVEGETITIYDLFQAMLIASANDATLALASRLAGDIEDFVDLMNQKVSELELYNTHFIEPTGLSNDMNHYSTAHDLARMCKYLIDDYGDQVLAITSMKETSITLSGNRELILSNTNPVIKEKSDYDGLKTGYTQRAGYNLIATKNTSEGRLLSVVLGCPSEKERKRMTEYLFKNYNDSLN
jgi:serine-type D-Ala-D-Ala carboxypeptidase (penicillin-binding protein 5/6)